MITDRFDTDPLEMINSAYFSKPEALSRDYPVYAIEQDRYNYTFAHTARLGKIVYEAIHEGEAKGLYRDFFVGFMCNGDYLHPHQYIMLIKPDRQVAYLKQKNQATKKQSTTLWSRIHSRASSVWDSFCQATGVFIKEKPSEKEIASLQIRQRAYVDTLVSKIEDMKIFEDIEVKTTPNRDHFLLRCKKKAIQEPESETVESKKSDSVLPKKTRKIRKIGNYSKS